MTFQKDKNLHKLNNGKTLTRFSSILLLMFFCFSNVRAVDLFSRDMAVQDGINVFETSDDFAEIFEKLDSVKWSGKNVSVAIEGLEKIHPDAHIAATDDRVVLVWQDKIIGNWPRPDVADWQGFGQITTAIVLKLRERLPSFAKLSQSAMYSAVVSAFLQGIDENGKYVYSKQAEIIEDGRLLTSAGIEGSRDKNGNFRINGIVRGSAADNNGLKESDLVFEINGRDVSKMTDADLAAEFSGFNSGTIKLLIASEGDKSPRNVVLRRATIVMADADVVFKNIESTDKTKSNLGILDIIVHEVSNNSVSIVNEALSKYKNVSGIVLDLRSAGGEDENTAAKMGGLFMGKQSILRIIETAKQEIEVVAGGDRVTDAPVVVLVSGATNGTAEALAAAFYETNRGAIVGTPTAGSARLATYIDLKGGGQLELLNRAAKTSRGHDLDGRGVFPIVCLSNIRNEIQQKAFFVNASNGDFNFKDFNIDMTTPVADIRKGCPQIKSGADEDALSDAISTKILIDQKVYNGLMER